MTRVAVLVVDGLGIGAMPDASALRAGDAAAHTLGHVLDAAGGTPRLPALGALGLGLLHPHESLAFPVAAGASAGRSALGYPGADTFSGHQTMMGTDMSGTALALFSDHIDTVAAALSAAGHTARPLDDLPVLLVDGSAIVGDNLEADPGLGWNVSARLDDLPFEAVLAIARTVRAVAPAARVIAVGGHGPAPLPRAVRSGAGGTAGLDTPASGFYVNDGLRVAHLAVQIDHARQLPSRAAAAGLPVTLVGKAADIITCPPAEHRPAVETGEVLAQTSKALARTADALVVANVQETDLAGHQQDARRFGSLLEEVDTGLASLLAVLGPDDHLIVTGDHGNDPTIGHPFHTREFVPVLHYNQRLPTGTAPDASTLATIAATAARALGIDLRE
ncbi:phosphopentomutase [Actinomadura madurae]|uniref:phosphopentomutase n=1 Tax=Actinomadura madurae TaxID=1993 RepID=UPI0020263F1D|nr:phosphopentomutase [Actinomadura madurae]MCP9955275.1 phosphopentomutase [Actinomadura madurae]MCP9984514.1 phosphopentomutase [Actinomadura madurae]MCQ0003935.1 phosphopentomutase [Actinomadura madurae]MCQ0020703.1 phosphopentomutase [Actinomadura madurae]URN00742.1 phosphopentomutase [Actinomadura madurae]